MSVITLVLILCFLGFVAWLVNYKVPIGPTFKAIINVVLVIVAVVLVLVAFGVWDNVRNVQVPKI
jgi:hypothetical protein